MIIAVDGPAASGKGTLAKMLARHFGLDYLDSGSLYRAVAWTLLSSDHDPADETAAVKTVRKLDLSAIDARELRSKRVGSAASIVAEFPKVREALLDYQREFARRGAVIDGRDIGTIVAPDADVKMYITASLDVRARRRTNELAEQGASYEEGEIRNDLAARDRRDTMREVAPLRRAEDALLLDTTDLDIETAFQAAIVLIEGQLE
jgi:cytidylate kinase